MSIPQELLDQIRDSAFVETLSDDTGVIQCWLCDMPTGEETPITVEQLREIEQTFHRWTFNADWKTNKKGQLERWWCVPVGAPETRVR